MVPSISRLACASLVFRPLANVSLAQSLNRYARLFRFPVNGTRRLSASVHQESPVNSTTEAVAHKSLARSDVSEQPPTMLQFSIPSIPSTRMGHCDQGYEAKRRRDFPAAIKHFTLALIHETDFMTTIAILRARASTFIALNSFPEAINDYKHVIRIEQQFQCLRSKSYLALAQVYDRLENYSEAEAVLCEGAENMPHSLLIHYALARYLLATKGDTEGAVKHFQKALDNHSFWDLDPNLDERVRILREKIVPMLKEAKSSDVPGILNELMTMEKKFPLASG